MAGPASFYLPQNTTFSDTAHLLDTHLPTTRRKENHNKKKTLQKQIPLSPKNNNISDGWSTREDQGLA